MNTYSTQTNPDNVNQRHGFVRTQGENEPFGFHGNVFRVTDVETLVITNPRYLASKVQTDLMRLHRYYETPSKELVNNLFEELVLAMKHDLVKSMTYGYCIGFEWVKGLHYESRQGGILTRDDDPGGVAYKELPEGAHWHSILEFNANWRKKPSEYKEFKRFSPIDRGTEPAPHPSQIAFSHDPH